MDKHDVLKKIGNECRELRLLLGLKQTCVAVDTNYSQDTISGFENGRNNNMFILLWYINYGLDLESILEEYEGAIHG